MRGGNWSGPAGLQLPRGPLASDRPPWVASTLAAILIFTIVVDVLGNLLVILSVCRNKKLRNAGPTISSIAFMVIKEDPFFLFQQWKSWLDPTHGLSTLVKFHTYEKVSFEALLDALRQHGRCMEHLEHQQISWLSTRPSNNTQTQDLMKNGWTMGWQ